MPVYQHDLVEEAIRFYARDCKARGRTYEQPASSSYVNDDGLVVLENMHGTLARYRPVSEGSAGGVRFLRVEERPPDDDDDVYE